MNARLNTHMNTGKFSELDWRYIGRHNGVAQYRLKKKFFYFEDYGSTIIVPEGFVTDLDSVPRLPLIYAAFKGRAIQSAVVHDYLYESQAGKAYADRTFLRAMADEGVDPHWRYPIYWAVAVCGGGIYEGHGKRKYA